jgi:hypothetical protein
MLLFVLNCASAAAGSSDHLYGLLHRLLQFRNDGLLTLRSHEYVALGRRFAAAKPSTILYSACGEN